MKVLKHNFIVRYAIKLIKFKLILSFRKMFPKALMVASGLNPTARYDVTVTFESVGDETYKFDYVVGWRAVSRGQRHSTVTYVHPKSPSSGREWMEMTQIDFDAAIRFTNNHEEYRGDQVD